LNKYKYILEKDKIERKPGKDIFLGQSLLRKEIVKGQRKNLAKTAKIRGLS